MALLLAAVPTAAFALLGWRWLGVPWLPVAMLGTAVSFIVGFKNNASYERMWEARRIWGGIVNSSRTFGLMARDFLSARHSAAPCTEAELADARRTLYLRHFAWLTALRYQLRQPRVWEAVTRPHNAEYRRRWYRVEEQETPLGPALATYLSAEEVAAIDGKQNQAAQILALQSAHFARLLQFGWIEDFRHMELTRVLGELLNQQGASERIKNFPYPRQYATLNLWFVRLFVVFVPLGMVREFDALGGPMVWLTIPFSALVSWIFLTMEKIGESSENPFEGSANDVPITQLSRAIEIDLRQMLGEADVPKPLGPQNNILM